MKYIVVLIMLSGSLAQGMQIQNLGWHEDEELWQTGLFGHLNQAADNNQEAEDLGPQKYQCDYQGCNKEYRYATSLRRHVNYVHKGVMHLCPLCSYRAAQKSTLRRHVERRHLKKRYFCDECDKSYSDKCTLKRHKEKSHY